MAELTFEEKLESMIEAVEIEQSRLLSIGDAGAHALGELLDYPESLVRLYDILTKGAGNA